MLALGCSADADPDDAREPRPPIVWTGEHLELGTERSLDEVCAGTLPWADRFVGYVGDVFGNPDAFVSSYWIDEDIERYCTLDVDCAIGDEAFSRNVVNSHELVHASRMTQMPHRALEEGIAELYGGAVLGTYPLEGDAESLLREHGGGALLPAELYGRAGHFASFLRFAYGEQTLVDLRAASSWEDDWSQTQATFMEVFGVPLAEVVATYELFYPDMCDGSQFRDTNFDCQGDFVTLPSEAGAAPVVIEQDLACSDDEVFGLADGARRRTFRLRVEHSAMYHLRMDTRGTAATWRISGRPCDQSCMNIGPEPDFGRADFVFAANEGDDWPRTLFCFPAGDYEIVVSTTASAEQSPRFSLWLEYVGQDDECEVR
ncbi:MAG: hypothetical protein U0168_25890 [Nannocystaceae bacterium]